MEIKSLKVSKWAQYKGLLHGFLGRGGGRSTGAYAGLNLSFRVGDDPRIVKDNICDMKRAVGVHDARIITMKQVHGDHIIQVKDRNIKEAGEADGMVTEEKRAYLGVLTADCVPILLIVPERRIAAVVHAGWRGTVAGIAAKMMQRLGEHYGVAPEQVEAALGPSIGACCYQIGEDVTKPLVEKWDGIAQSSLQTRNGKQFLDLRNLNRAILERARVPTEQIFQIGPCTGCATDDFFSYRKEQRETGRQISFIGWLP
jgi:YfiH family protein